MNHIKPLLFNRVQEPFNTFLKDLPHEIFMIKVKNIYFCGFNFGHRKQLFILLNIQLWQELKNWQY